MLDPDNACKGSFGREMRGAVLEVEFGSEQREGVSVRARQSAVTLPAEDCRCSLSEDRATGVWRALERAARHCQSVQRATQ